MYQLQINTTEKTVEITDSSNNRVCIPCDPPHKIYKTTCFGFYGCIEIKECVFLICITKRNKRDQIENCDVFEIAEVEVIPLTGPSFKHHKMVATVKSFFNIPGMYYSDYPLYKESSIGKTDGEDFIFNSVPKQLMSKYSPQIAKYTINCIQGYYGLQECNGIKLYLISRRSWRRAGARFFSRGSSSSGYVSNFVETELLLFQDKNKRSYLQVRGSIPLVWSHNVSTKYTPNLIIKKYDVFTKANEILVTKYNNVFYLNLIKDKLYEKPINRLFIEKLEINKCNYLHYDVHSKGSFATKALHNEFLTHLLGVIYKYGFYSDTTTQRGVIRTNCIDCLDRTNLCQFIISEYVLKGMAPQIDNDFLHMHRKLWVENGNNLSIQYAETYALKSHVVGGNRKIFGNIQDLFKSISRYFINRYCHGDLQNCYDILTVDNKFMGDNPLLMAVAAHIEGNLILDIFESKINIKCDSYSIKNNILVYTNETELCYYDLLKNISIKTFHIFSKAVELKQSANGKISGLLNEESVLLVYDSEKEILMEKNVKKFEVSNTTLAYSMNDNMFLKHHYKSLPFYKSIDIYSNFYVYDEFCVLSTRKSIKDNHHKIFKIDEAGSIEIGVFEIMEHFSCKINKENTHLLIKLATSYVKNSYFAHTELYLYDIKQNKLSKVQKIHNISDFEFVEGGFVVIFGSQPSNVIVFNYEMVQTKRFPKGLRNQIYYNPQFNIVALAGFGQLSGDIEIYDTVSMEKYAEISELGANNIKWDVNGAYFYVSTTKYLKEDNKITKYDYFGREIKEEKYDALISSEVYGLDSEFLALERPEVLTRVRRDIYVPPHLTNKTKYTSKQSADLKAPNSDFKNKAGLKILVQESLESLHKTLKDIEALQTRMKAGESLSTKEMNLMLKEDAIKEKIKKYKQ